MPDLYTITITPPERHRFHLLDALRGIAAILVADLHTAGEVHSHLVAFNAPLAVDFFFCLSGFVIAFSYERRLLEGLSVRNFMASRLIRLYPMFFLGMLIGVLKPAIEQLHRSDFTILKQKTLFFLQAIVLVPNLSVRREQLVFPLDNASWSLFFELVANLVFGLIALRRRVPNWLLLAGFLGSATILSVRVLAGVPIFRMGPFSLPSDFVMGFPRTAMSFCAGVLALRVYRRKPHWPLTPAVSHTLAVAIVGVLLFVLSAPYEGMTSPLTSLAIIILLMPLLVFAGSIARMPRIFDGICSLLGEISYPLYLLNIVFSYSFGRNALRLAAHFPVLRPWLLPGVLAVDILLAFAASRCFDLPVRRWAQRFYNACFPHPTHSLSIQSSGVSQ